MNLFCTSPGSHYLCARIISHIYMLSDPSSADPAAVTQILSMTSEPEGTFSLLIVYALFAIITSFFCSVLESVFLSTPVTFINLLEEQGNKEARHLKKLKASTDRPLSAILTINTIANTAGASLVGSEAGRIFESTGVGIISAVFTVCILLFSEIIPKTIGSTYWRALSIPASRIIRGLIFITWPIVWVIEKLTHLISSKNETTSISREEVVAMVTTGTEEGVIEKDENRMIQNLLRLDDITAYEIMTPSSVVTMAEASETIRDFYKNEDSMKFSRIPLYEEENDDFVIGYVLKQEILEKMAEDKFTTKMKDLSRPILSFNEEEPVSNILEKFLGKKEHIAVVIDDFGAARGIVTLEDVIETMLGFEIVDEKDEVVDMQELAKDRWRQVQEKAKEEYEG